MTLRSFNQAVKQKIFDDFTAGGLIDPTTHVQWPNQSFEFPKTGAFGRVSILYDNREKQEMNNYPFKTAFGSAEISIYSRGKSSTEAHDDVVQSMIPSLDDVVIEKAQFETTRVITVGRLDAYWVTRLSTLFANYDS